MTNDRVGVVFTREAEKELANLRPWSEDVLEVVMRLRDDPTLGHLLTGTLRGMRSLEFTVKGSGAYRAIYTILDDGQLCLVVLIGPHENVYKKAERRVSALRKSGRI